VLAPIDKNIGGYVVLLVRGKDVRHEGLQTVAAELYEN